MTPLKRLFFLAAALCWHAPTLLAAPPQSGLALSAPAAKKLIKYGWDRPTPEVTRDNIATMEREPFDGIVMGLPAQAGGGEVFNLEKWDTGQAILKQQLPILASIKWGKFTDNFLLVRVASTMDWQSDADWKKVTAHAKMLARAARAGNCAGIVFDPEPYGFNPWQYTRQKHNDTLSFAQYQHLVRRRGQQFMQALQSEMPGIKLLMFYQFKLPLTASQSPDPLKREAALTAFQYGLFPAFLNGMLHSAKPGVQFIDGNESAYTYESADQFYRAYHDMRQTAKLFVEPQNQPKFDRQVRAGQAVYADYLFNSQNTLINLPSQMTPQERASYYEHNLYHALNSSDEYVWLYTEKMNWWKHDKLPPGIVEATVAAREKLRNGQQLGFDMNAILKSATSRREAAIRGRIVQRTAQITRLQPGHKPLIDGKLDEALYREIAPLEPFVSFFDPTREAAAKALKASTTSWITYNDTHLYVTFRCEEPFLDKLKFSGKSRDDALWSGDCVEFSIAATPSEAGTHLPAKAMFYHFIFDARGTVWDALAQGGVNDAAFNAAIQTAAQIGQNEWTLEIAIPWQELKMSAPAAGTHFNANLARLRLPEREYSSWSQFLSGYQETENFGSLIF